MKKILTAAFLAISCSAFAAITFEDDFESDTVSSTPAATEWSNTSGMTVQSGTPFDSQWLKLEKTGSASWSYGELDPADAAVMTLSFDGYFDATAFADGYLRAVMFGESSQLNRLDFGKSWDLLQGEEFSLDKLQHFDVVMNMSGAGVDYNGTNIAHDTFAVWVDSQLVLQATMDQAGSSANTNVTKIGLWMNSGTAGSAVYMDNVEVRNEAYVYQLPYDTVFYYNFNDWTDAREFTQDAAGWATLNQWGWGYVHTNAAGARLVHRPDSTNAEFTTTTDGYNWRGVIYTNGTGRAVAEGETLEFTVDYTMFAYTDVSLRNGIDFFFTTNNISRPADAPAGNDTASQQSFGTYPDGQIGFRVRQSNWVNSGAWPDGGMIICMDPANPTTSDGSINLNTIGITNIAGGASADVESDPVAMTFTAKKTSTNGVWNLTMTLADQDGNTLKTISKPSWTNQALYDASNVYFGMYSYNATTGEEGTELDNLSCRILHSEAAPTTPWEDFTSLYGLSGVPTDDKDSDGLNDYGEYVFGGNPDDGGTGDVGTQPTFAAATGSYVFSLIGDDTVVAHVVTTDDLVGGSWTTNGTVSVTATDGVLGAYTNTVDTSGAQLFIKLLVE